MSSPVSKTELQRYEKSNFDFSDAARAIQLKSEEQKNILNAIVKDLITIAKNQRLNVDEQNFEFLRKFFENLEEQADFYSIYFSDSVINSAALTEASLNNLPSGNVFSSLKSMQKEISTAIGKAFDDHRIRMKKLLSNGKSVDENRKYSSDGKTTDEAQKQKEDASKNKTINIQDKIDDYEKKILQFEKEESEKLEKRLLEIEMQYSAEKKQFEQSLKNNSAFTPSQSTKPSGFGAVPFVFSGPRPHSAQPAGPMNSVRTNSSFSSQSKPPDVAKERLKSARKALLDFKNLYDEEVKKRLDKYTKISKNVLGTVLKGVGTLIKAQIDLLVPLAWIAFPLKIITKTLGVLFVVGKKIFNLAFKALKIVATISWKVLNLTIIKPLSFIFKKISNTGIWKVTKKLLLQAFKTPWGAFALGFVIGGIYGFIKKKINEFKGESQTFGEALKTKTLNAFSTVKKDFEETKTGKWLIPKLQKILDPIFKDNKLSEMYEWLKNNISIEFVIDKVGDMLSWVMNTLSGVYESFKDTLIKNAAASVGSATGAIIGGAVGSVLPGVGTAIGTLVGGMIGSFAGPFIYESWQKLTGRYYKPAPEDSEDRLYAYANMRADSIKKENEAKKGNLISKSMTSGAALALEDLDDVSTEGGQLTDSESAGRSFLSGIKSAGGFNNIGDTSSSIAQKLENAIESKARGERSLASTWNDSVYFHHGFEKDNTWTYDEKMKDGYSSPDLPLEIDVRTGKFSTENVPFSTDDFGQRTSQYFGGRRLINPFAYRLFHAIIAEQLLALHRSGKLSDSEFVFTYNAIKDPSNIFWRQIVGDRESAAKYTVSDRIVSDKVIDFNSFVALDSNLWYRPDSDDLNTFEKNLTLAHSHIRGMDSSGMISKIHLADTWYAQNKGANELVDGYDGTVFSSLKNQMVSRGELGIKTFALEQDSGTQSFFDSMLSNIVAEAKKLELNITNEDVFKKKLGDFILGIVGNINNLDAKADQRITRQMLQDFNNRFIVDSQSTDHKYLNFINGVLTAFSGDSDLYSYIDVESISQFQNTFSEIVQSKESASSESQISTPSTGLEIMATVEPIQDSISVESQVGKEALDAAASPSDAVSQDALNAILRGQDEIGELADQVNTAAANVKTKTTVSVSTVEQQTRPPLGLAGKDSGQYSGYGADRDMGFSTPGKGMPVFAQ